MLLIVKGADVEVKDPVSQIYDRVWQAEAATSVLMAIVDCTDRCYWLAWMFCPGLMRLETILRLLA